MFVGYFAVDSRKVRSGTCSPILPNRGVVGYHPGYERVRDQMQKAMFDYVSRCVLR